MRTSKTAEKQPIRDAMQEAREYFEERASSETSDKKRELYDQMRQVVGAVEETASQVSYLKIQVDELRQAVGLHLESTGTVPHTRRSGRG